MRSFLLCGFLAVAAASASARPAPVQLPPQLPPQLRGAWSMGGGSCRLPRDLYAENVIRIFARRIDAYESTFTARQVTRVTSYPSAWRMVMDEDFYDDVNRSNSLYVLSGDVLRISEGNRTDRYVRCRNAPRTKQVARPS